MDELKDENYILLDIIAGSIKSENGWTEWTIEMKLCIYIDIDKM